MNKQGHPLPDSEEARHDEIPEHLEREKGRGDDYAPVIQPDGEAVNPDGEPYPYADLGRGPGMASGGLGQESSGTPDEPASEEFASDQAQHQDRGQSTAQEEVEDR